MAQQQDTIHGTIGTARGLATAIVEGPETPTSSGLKTWKHNYTQNYFTFSNVRLSSGALQFYQPAGTSEPTMPLSELILEPDVPETMKIKEVRPH